MTRGRPRTIDRDQAHDMREAGLTLRAIAETLGCSTSGIRRVLSEPRCAEPTADDADAGREPGWFLGPRNWKEIMARPVERRVAMPVGMSLRQEMEGD